MYLAHGHEGIVVDVVGQVVVQVHLVSDHEVKDVVGPVHGDTRLQKEFFKHKAVTNQMYYLP
jgi:hypothetical protein